MAVLVTYVDGILLAGDHKEGVQGMINRQMETNQGQDLFLPDKQRGVALMVTDKDAKLDEALYNKSSKGRVL